jgi:hypothetical protein
MKHIIITTIINLNLKTSKYLRILNKNAGKIQKCRHRQIYTKTLADPKTFAGRCQNIGAYRNIGVWKKLGACQCWLRKSRLKNCLTVRLCRICSS